MAKSNENLQIPCALGIMFLMCAFACAIYVGTSQLIIHDPYTYPTFIVETVMTLILVLVFSSLFGGYLTSYGLMHILRNSRQTESSTQQ